ncbi:efflux RND transporter periplasmic adaptor subunit [Anaeromyxobacter paludicola]|uniref:MexH family multidrug efflux RND transporter periplasmic adaptor subunit n=1 Tax=Anaeromyxobacter paludicola TaxID=2918171 RepID=A0ABM7X683_9BACT|nr:efflux RND transporter periplasmic adaptor subunit [Anaeromyxobacter paludicola]BDG07316.1 MexH family multidrug efflux RND transporter periplasmic adaptor subunit [Anaeromyxobacter paludicola]
MKTKTKLWIVALAGIVLILGVLVGVKALQIGTLIKAGKSQTLPPQSVTSTKVEPGEWEASRSAVGTVVAVHAATLGAELSGVVREVDFDSGSNVRKGAVLVKLDTSTEEAQLASAQAEAQLARINLERAQRLRKEGSNAPAELDAAEARHKQADAAVTNLKATIAKKVIRAPFDGRIAIRQVEVGQVVSPGTAVASLQSVDPIYAEFALPQQALADLRTGQPTRMTTDIFPGSSWQGTVSAVNTEVDPATRNVRVRATFRNADGRLRPGMFVNVDVVSSGKRPVLVIPATSVVFAPYGDSVFAVEEKKDDAGKAELVARQKFVRLGERRGDLVAVASGLQAGEVVVSSGAFKLKNGMAVVVHNELAPKAELAPRPVEE